MNKLPLALVAMALVTGCSLIPEYSRPQMEVPAAFTDPATEPTQIAFDWWKSFGSFELDGFMDEALKNNNDLLASVQRINQAQALLKTANSSLFPSVDYSAGASRDRTTRPDSMDTNLSAGITAAYEVDLFGGNRAGVTSAEVDVAASHFDHEALRLVVMANVAQTYFNVLNARERLRIADVNLKNNREVLRIVSARYDAGAADALDVARQKSELASAEAARASVELQRKNAENALAVLVGRPPENIEIKAQNLTPLKIPQIAPGQPSELLERRPDIRENEAILVAANADIGAVRAAFFPSITIGLDAATLATGIGNPAGTALSLSAGALGPLFRGGRLSGELERVKARRAELVENYRKSVLVSFQDVEDSLASVKAAQTRESSLRTAMTEARKSYELSRSQYDSGAIDFQTLLDAQRTVLQAEDAFATSKNERLSAAVNLFKALGGGWQE